MEGLAGIVSPNPGLREKKVGKVMKKVAKRNTGGGVEIKPMIRCLACGKIIARGRNFGFNGRQQSFCLCDSPMCWAAYARFLLGQIGLGNEPWPNIRTRWVADKVLQCQAPFLKSTAQREVLRDLSYLIGMGWESFPAPTVRQVVTAASFVTA
jgi:hypothetical protein